MKQSLIAKLLILVGGIVSTVEHYDRVGQPVLVTKVFNLETGDIEWVQPFSARLVLENEWVDLPDGVFTQDYAGTGADHFLPDGSPDWSSAVWGVRVRRDMDDIPGIFVPWYQPTGLIDTTTPGPFPPNPYRYNIGSKISVTTVLKNGVRVKEKFSGIVTGHHVVFDFMARPVECWVVKHARSDGYAAPIYDDDEDDVPVN